MTNMRTKLSQYANWAILILITLFFIFPFYFIIVTAFKSGPDLTLNPIGLPTQYQFGNFVEVFAGTKIFQSIVNSILVSTGTIVIGLIIYVASSYGLYRLKGTILGTVLFSIIVFGMMIPAVGYWQMILTYRKYHLYNNLTGVILGLVASSLPFSTLLIVGHLKTIPNDLIDSAGMDGASDMQLLRHVIVPLAQPIMLTITIFLLVESWNNLILPLLLLRDESLYTLPIQLKSTFFRQYAPRYELFFAGALITSMPFIITYIFFQKHFVYGLGGALKE